MKNINFIKIGVGTLVILGIVYVGNLVMKTAPSGVANGPYQYKVEAFDIGASDTVPGTTFEKQLNAKAKEGWVYDSNVAGFLIFRK
jgi:hypothetical protein